MKKTWNVPEIEKLDLSATSYEVLDGKEVDGVWLDSQECKYKDAYFAS